MYDAVKTVKIAAYVTVKSDDKPNCKQIVTVFNEAKAGNNKFEEYVNDLLAEAGLGSDFDFNINDMRMVWMGDCVTESVGFISTSYVCNEMEPYKLYLLANNGDVTIINKLFDKKLDNSEVFSELIDFLK